MSDLENRFLSKVIKTDTCWLWQAALKSSGYGAMYREGVLVPAHRIAYELYKGSIPQGLHIDHLCKNRLCVNPEHLEAVSQKENNRRSEGVSTVNARKTHCPNGHPYSAENTGPLRPKSGVGRRCLICHREREQRRYQEKKNERK